MADLAHDDPVAFSVQQHRTWAWRQVKRLATKAQSEGVRLAACREFLSRTDPLPKAEMTAEFNGPVQITWRLESSKSLPPSPTNGSSTNGSAGTTFSSATGDSGKPSWL